MNETQSISAVVVQDLRVYFPLRAGLFGATVGHVKAVDGVSFSIGRSKIFALVGESGCGKTTTAHAVLGLRQPTSGKITLNTGTTKTDEVSWDALSAAQQRARRRHVQVIFQDPFSSLNPRMTVAATLEEPLIVHGMGKKAQRHERVVEMLNRVGLSTDHLHRYPHEFSGGQRQRIGIARALMTGPDIVIADEPVSALDVSIQAQIINLLQDLQANMGLTMLFISHSLAVVRHLADRVAIMYLGIIVEEGSDEQIFGEPRHPYTVALLQSVPEPGIGRRIYNAALPDDMVATAKGVGCPFYTRCTKSTPKCAEAQPQLKDIGQGHLVACFRM